jgi:hypothetical protein
MKICLCGSFDDRAYIHGMAGGLLSKGYEVLLPNFWLGRRPNTVEKDSLMKTHFWRIQQVRAVLFCFATKIGFNSIMELGVAVADPERLVMCLVGYNLEDKVPDEIEAHTSIFMKYIDSPREDIEWIISNLALRFI